MSKEFGARNKVITSKNAIQQHFVVDNNNNNNEERGRINCSRFRTKRHIDVYLQGKGLTLTETKALDVDILHVCSVGLVTRRLKNEVDE